MTLCLTIWQEAGLGKHPSPGLKLSCREAKSGLSKGGCVILESKRVTPLAPPTGSPSFGKFLVQAGPATITSTGVTATSRLASEK